MRASPLDYAAVLAVAGAMREADRAEIYALCWPGQDTPEHLAAEVMRVAQFGGVIYETNGCPAAVIGLAPCWPGVFNAFLFATEAWPAVWREAVKFGQRILMPAATAAGGWRAQCHSLAAHRSAHRFLIHLGFQAEGHAVPMGRSREAFIPFAWVSR